MSSTHRFIATDASAKDWGRTMDQATVEKCLRFFISKLSEPDLREFDNYMAGSSLDTPQPIERAKGPAMDAAITAAFGDEERRRYLALGPTARNGIRRGRTNAVRGFALDAAPADDKPEFPNANRLSAA